MAVPTAEIAPYNCLDTGLSNGINIFRQSVLSLYSDQIRVINGKIWEDIGDASETQTKLQLPIRDIEAAISRLSFERDQVDLNPGGLFRLAGTLIMFSDISKQPIPTTPYQNLTDLHDGVRTGANEAGQPLNYAEQLKIALEQADGFSVNALWNLFLASRLFARWMDESIVSNMPDLTRTDKIEISRIWSNSIAATKPPNPSARQDIDGDNYYCWTHAFAENVFGSQPNRRFLGNTFRRIFSQGTTLMQYAINNPISTSDGTLSDHRRAMAYGKSIGSVMTN